MPIIPLEIPEPSKITRGNIPSNLARRIGPLFGVVSVRSPFGRTWISDYDKTTLREMGRGAPAIGTRAIADLGETKEITPATLNRFDPDTKAAVMLTAANVLFADMADDMTSALSVMARANNTLSPSILIMAWGAGCLTAFRSYPLLMVSALKARSIQRSMLARWNVTVPNSWTDQASCEFTGAAEMFRPTLAPRQLDLLDSTLRALAQMLADRWELGDVVGAHDAHRSTLDHELAAEDFTSRVDSVSATMSRLLRELGGDGEGEPAVIWAIAQSPGNRTIDVYMPPLRVLTTFMAQQSGSRLPGAKDDSEDALIEKVVPKIPSKGDLAMLRPNARRMLISILAAVTRALRERVHFSEESRVGAAALGALQEVAELAVQTLEESDAVRLDAVVAAQTALVRAQIRARAPLDVTPLIASMDTTRSALVDGKIDAGIGLEILDRGCLALKRARDHVTPNSRLDEHEVAERLERFWATFEDLLVTASQIVPGASAAGYHMHDYAGYLASRVDSPSSLSKSRSYFRDYVIPSRIAAATSSGRTQTLRISYQIAARASLALARAERAQGNLQLAKSLATEARMLAMSALQTEDARELLDESEPLRETTYLLALEVVPAILLAHELDVEELSQKERGRTWRLVDRAEAWVNLLPERKSGEPGERVRTARSQLATALGASK